MAKSSSSKLADSPVRKVSRAKAPRHPAPPAARTIVIAVCGMSPAILTETVWALAHPPAGRDAVVPNEVAVITTTRGAADLTRDLLTPADAFGGRTVWQALRDAVANAAGRPPESPDLLQLAGPRIIELPDPKRGVKRKADDIRSAEDNAATADFVLEAVRGYVENPETRVIASIAGGRKTMGALLYAAMTLLGRETDRVTHVLVNEPFDQCRGFFFPGQPMQDLSAGPRDNLVRVRADEAKIELADIPFVPLRNRFLELADLPGNFGSLVRRYASQLRTDASRTVPIVIDYARNLLGVDGSELRMRRRALTILHYFLQCQEEGRTPRGQLEAVDDFKAWRERTPQCEESKCDQDDFRHELSHLRAVLRKAGSPWQIPVRSLVFPPFKLLVR